MSELKITITVENEGGSASGSMVLNLKPAAPTYLGTLENQDATVGEAFSYETAPHFSGRDLVFSATGLPQGLAIDTDTGLVSGTPL